jgi:predicted kinase
MTKMADQQTKAKLYVLVGVPGSGKSTWVSNQLWAKDCAYVSTDGYVDRFAARMKKTYSEVFQDVMPRAIRLMMRAVRKAQREGKDVIWDQTSTTVASRARKFSALPEYYTIAVVFKTPTSRELRKRLASRPGKHIPWKVVSGMINGFVMPSEEEGFDEIWYAQ